MMSEGKENTKVGGVQAIQMAKYVPHDRTVDSRGRKEWVNYGVLNDYPAYLIELFRRSGDHHAITTSISMMVAGKPFNAGVISHDTIRMAAFDLKLHGGFYLEIIMRTDLTGIAQVNAIPFEQVRLGKRNEDNEIDCVFFHRTWVESDMRATKPVAVNVFPEKPDGEGGKYLCGRYVYVAQMETPGSQYYPDPDYIGAIDYIELDVRIAEFHNNNIANGLMASFMVDFFNGDPGPEARGAILSEITRNLAGSENAGRFVASFNDPSAKPPTYTTFPISDADKQYQFLVELASNKILRGHRVTSPLLFGIRDGGGLGSNTDEMQTALDIFNQFVIKPMQEILIKAIKSLTGQDVVIPSNMPLAVLAEAAKPASEPAKLIALSANNQMTDEAEAQWLEHLSSRGEVIDGDVWELVEEVDIKDPATETQYAHLKMSSDLARLNFFSQYASADERSDWGDSGLYKLRYQYAGNISVKSRMFCIQMIALAAVSTVYRFEDIIRMGEAGENSQFAPSGQSTYSIFEWKGGVNCHHYWKRQIYFRKRGANGAFLPNKGLENDKRVGNVPFVPQKGAEGVRPIDTPNKGSLKNS